MLVDNGCQERLILIDDDDTDSWWQWWPSMVDQAENGWPPTTPIMMLNRWSYHLVSLKIRVENHVKSAWWWKCSSLLMITMDRLHDDTRNVDRIASPFSITSNIVNWVRGMQFHNCNWTRGWTGATGWFHYVPLCENRFFSQHWIS